MPRIFPTQITRMLLLLVALMVGGTLGYMQIEGWQLRSARFALGMMQPTQAKWAAFPRSGKNTRRTSMTMLMQAVKANDAARVQSLLEQGADVNELDANEDAPLVMAAYEGYTDIVRLLLAAGADVTAVDPGMKATALHAAAYAGRTDAARLLIAYGIDLNKQGPYNGYTALHDAIWQNHVEPPKSSSTLGQI